MSAAGTRELLSTAVGVQQVARCYLSVELSERDAARFCVTLQGGVGWMNTNYTTSVGPVVWLKSRLLEAGILRAAVPDDDILPLTFVTTRDSEQVARICNVARSKMFDTPLVVYPINLVSGRVTGLEKRMKTAR